MGKDKLVEESGYCRKCKKPTKTYYNRDTGLTICGECYENKPVRNDVLIVPFIREALLVGVAMVFALIGLIWFFNYIITAIASLFK